MASLKELTSKVVNYFNPSSNGGQNFWNYDNPLLKGVVKVQQAIQNTGRAVGNEFNKEGTSTANYIKSSRAQGLNGIPVESNVLTGIIPKLAAKGVLPKPIQSFAENPINTAATVPSWNIPAKIGLGAGDFVANMAKGTVFGDPKTLKVAMSAEQKMRDNQPTTPEELAALKQVNQQQMLNFVMSSGGLKASKADVAGKFGNMDMVYQNMKTGEAKVVPENLRELAALKDSVGKNGEWHISAMEKGTMEQKLKDGGWKLNGSVDKKFLNSLPVGENLAAREKVLNQTVESGQTLPQPAQQTLEPSQLNPKLNPSYDNTIPQGSRERGLVGSIKGSANVGEPTKVGVGGNYVPKANDKLMGEAKALLNEGASIDFKNTKNLDQKVAATIQEAINLDKSGNHEAAATLFNNLSEHATELGRGVQAFSMIDKMSPEAISLSTAGKIKKFNATHTTKIPELTGEQQKMISDAVAKIDTLVGREKNIAINELQNKLNEFIPSSITDKVITVWKAGLLTSLRTHERNLLGNTIMGASEVAKDVPAAIMDRLMSFKTGKRSLSFSTKTGQGYGKGAQAALDIVSKGFDPEESISKFDTHQVTWGKNPVEQALKKYTEFVFRTLGAEDKVPWNASFARSLYDQAGAEAINAGKQGNKAFIENLVNNPTEGMLTVATTDANYATFHDKNTLSGLASAFKNWAGKKWYTQLPAEVVAPFTGVPSSIVGKTVSYSPIGLAKGAFDVGRVLLSKETVPALQRLAAQEVGRGVMGTGLFGLGAYLMKKGLMTGQPKDAKESQQWQLENKPSNSVLIGGKWRSIGSIGPQNIVILAGAKYAEEMGKPDGSFGNYALGLGQDQLSQTFLSGVQQPLNALTDPARYGPSYEGNMASSFIPNIVKDTSKAFDPNARETNGVTDYIKSGIPGVRNTLLPKRDVLGNVVPQEPTGVGAFLDLLNSKTPTSNPVVDELSRLNAVGANATPSKLTKNQTLGGVKQVLTPEQLNSLEAETGPQVTQQLGSLFNSAGYKALSDEDKVKAIDSAVTTIRKKVRGTTNLSGTPSSAVSPAQQYILVNPDTGSVKNIDLSAPIDYPQLTGVDSIDTKLISGYKSDLNTRVKDAISLYKDGQITLEQASKIVNQLDTKIKSLAKPKKAPKVATVKFGKAKKMTMAKVKFKALPKIKISGKKPTLGFAKKTYVQPKAAKFTNTLSNLTKLA